MSAKQMRVPDAQYKTLVQLEEILGTSRADILTNIIRLVKTMVDKDVVRVKMISKNGEETEIIWTMVKE